MNFHSRLILLFAALVASVSADGSSWFWESRGACKATLSRTSELDANAPLIAFGLGDSSGQSDSRLAQFARSRAEATGHPVALYGNFVEARYLTAEEKTKFAVPRNVRNAIERAISLFPDRKVLQFNLDGFDPRLLFEADGRFTSAYTAFEAALILAHPKYLAATEWFLEGRVATDSEVRELFSSLFERLREDPDLLRRTYPGLFP